MKRFAGIIPGLVALIIYLLTTCRSIWIGDSGEFALAMKTLGICHPPGYPLFTLFGRIFISGLPFLRPVFAAGIFNIAVASAAVSVIFYIFRRHLGIWTSALISLVWALTQIFWEETSGVEVYALNLLLISLIFLALESEWPRKWPLVAYLFGLSLTNHPSALSIFPVLIYFYIKEKEYRNLRMISVYLGFILLAGSIYLYLPIRSSLYPISDWGHPANIRALLRHMTLAQYSGWISYSIDNLVMSFRLFFISILDSWWWIGIITALAGSVAGFKIARTRTVSAILIFSASVLLASSHRALNFGPFYIPAMFASLLLSGNLLIFITRRLKSRTAEFGISTLLSVACLILMFGNHRKLDKSGYTLAEQYGKSLLDTAETGILFTAGDINSFPTLYLRYAEGYRPDVEVFDRSIRLQALLKRASEISRRQISNYHEAREKMIGEIPGNKFLAKIHYVYELDWLQLKENIYSYGILYKVSAKPENSPAVLEFPADYEADDVLSIQLLINLDLARGEQILFEDPQDTSSALAAFEKAIKRLQDENQAVVLNNVGIYFRNAGFGNTALEVYRQALQKPLISKKDRNEILYNISNVYKDRANRFLSKGDFADAVINFRKALEYDPDNLDLILNIGLIYAQELDDNDKARIFLREYLEKNPSDGRVRTFLNNLR